MTTTTTPRILIGTEDEALASRLIGAVGNYYVDRVSSPKELWLSVRGEIYDVVIVDKRLGSNAARVLRRRLAVRERPPEVLELSGTRAEAVAADATLDEEETQLVAEVYAKVHRRRAFERTGLIGRSDALYRIAQLILQAAPTPVTVLIEGESGTGKEVVARAIHDNSKRAAGPFVVLSCGALAEGVLESELFGHEKGAFTGATSRRKGLFELAMGGTIFLDEVGELPLGTQVKLLRVLEEREFMRVGGTETLQTDARVVTATNRSLARDVEEGRFRQDLYFRLCVVRVDVPPLRERPEDIEPLFWHFVRQISEEVGRAAPQVSGPAVDKLGDHSWPGNVRELRNFVESVVVMRSGDEIRLEDVEAYVADRSRLNPRLPVLSDRFGERASLELVLDALVALKREVAELRQDLNLQRWTGPVHEIEVAHEVGQTPFPQWNKKERQATSIEEMERDTIERALREANGNRRKAAALLGIGERTLYRKIQKYGLQDVQ
jgi:DNA-binding NtrC family response regulator